MTRDAALAWQARWRLVSEVTDREVRQQSAADRLRMLSRLVAFARATGLGDTDTDEARVWDRFQMLRARLPIRAPRAR
jgi:hypothetical protein